MSNGRSRWMAKAVAATLCAAALTGGLYDGRAAQEELTLVKKTGRAFTIVAKKATPAVVFIQVEKTIQPGMRHGQVPGYNNPFDLFGDDFMQRFFHGYPAPDMRQRRFKQQGQGSGFIISEDGYILTNNHVVGDADKIRVKLSDGREFEAKRIGSDPKSEVAVIKIDAKDLPQVRLGDSAKLEIGEWVIAIGNPFGLSETLTVGVVSAKGRSNMGIADYEDFIQTDAAINPGNSGGPLLNIDGEVVGINTAIFSQSGGYMGIGFAIPINMAKAIKQQLVETGKVVRGYLGVHIQEFTEALAGSFGESESGGILVAQVTEGSPAEKAGLKQADVIRELNGQKIASVGAFRNDISSLPPGTEVALSVTREGKTVEIKALTGTLPGEEEREDDAADLLGKLGMGVGELTGELAERFNYELNEGVIVTEVASDSPAARADIRPGSLITGVNRARVRNLQDFQEALGRSASSGAVLLQVREDRFSRFVVLSLE